MENDKLDVVEELEEGDRLCFEVGDDSIGERIDRYLTEFADVSRSLAVKLIESGEATVCGKAVNKNYKLRRGDKVDTPCCVG